MITHYDLFAGIGGFSVAVDEVFDEPIRHIFCEWDGFCTQVLKKHWPNGEYWGDIAELVAHTSERNDRGSARELSQADELQAKERQEGRITKPSGTDFTLVTGGFPCQPFSAAGRRRGTSDNRYKWPEMFEVIRNVQPEWVIAENVRGLANWNDGLVLEQVCTDLESIGYEVQPLIIPAVAKNAPHRRDRVWIIANSVNDGQAREKRGLNGKTDSVPQEHRTQDSTARQSERTADDWHVDAPDTQRPGRGKRNGQGVDDEERKAGEPRQARNNLRDDSRASGERRSWNDPWPEVAAELCLVDDGLSAQLVRLPDGTQISYPKWRKESLKAGGNAIVPQVAIEILKAIKESL